MRIASLKPISNVKEILESLQNYKSLNFSPVTEQTLLSGMKSENTSFSNKESAGLISL
jgi:hypothetical protein